MTTTTKFSVKNLTTAQKAQARAMGLSLKAFTTKLNERCTTLVSAPAVIVPAKPAISPELETLLKGVLTETVDTRHTQAFLQERIGDKQAKVVQALLDAGLIDAGIVKNGSTKQLAPLIKGLLSEKDTFVNLSGNTVKHGAYATSRAVCFIAAYNKRHNLVAKTVTTKNGTVKNISVISKMTAEGVAKTVTVNTSVKVYSPSVQSVFESIMGEMAARMEALRQSHLKGT